MTKCHRKEIENFFACSADIDVLAANTITAADANFFNATISNAKIENENVTNSTIFNANITNETVVNSTITNAVITNETVTNQTITNQTISNSTVANLTVTGSIKIPFAPSVVTVNPNLPPNGLTQFTTIQGALDFLSTQQFPPAGVAVNIAGPLSTPAASGIYVENVVASQLDSSLESQLRLTGDTRPVVGCGIAHGMPWNQGGAATYPALGGTIASGIGQFATLSSAGNTITVGQVGGATLPNFTLAGLVPGDRVFIRNTNGVETVHTLVSFTATSLTMAAPIGLVNGVAAFMVIAPNVVIRPAAGVPFFVGATLIATGIWADAVGANQTAMRIGDLNAILRPVHCLATSTLFALEGGMVITDQLGGIVSGLDSAGSTYVATAAVAVQFAGTAWALLNSLAASRNVAGGTSVQLFGRTQLGMNGMRCLGAILITNQSEIFVNNNQLDIMSTSTQQSSSLFLQNASVMVWRININIQQPDPAYGLASPIGILLNNSDMVQRNTNSSPVSFSSTNPATTAVVQADAQSTVSRLILGNITLPSVAPAWIVKALNGSNVGIEAVSGTVSLGAAAQGFQILNNSQLTWSAGSFAPIAPTTGTMFDIQRNSSVVVAPLVGGRTFANFNRFFNVDKNSIVSVSDTATNSTTATAFLYQINNFSHVVAENSSATNGLVVGNNITNGSGMRRIASASIYASADASSQNL